MQLVNWIRCEDQLPEDDGDVLVSDGENISLSFHDSGGWQEEFHKVFWQNITHWMPLPNKPGNK